MLQIKKQNIENQDNENAETVSHFNAYKQHQKEYIGLKSVNFHSIAVRLIPLYRKSIQIHMNRYREEFSRYFSTHPTSIIAFDTESVHNKLICISCIIINPDLTFQLTVKVVENIYNLQWNSHCIQQEFTRWLQKAPKSLILSHGDNSIESQLIQSLGCIHVNTQLFLESLNQTPLQTDTKLHGIGLAAFESLIQFERLGCAMLKHKCGSKTQIRKRFFENALISLDRHYWKQPQCICEICHKPQMSYFIV